MYQYLLIETSKAFLQVGVCFPFLTVEVIRGFTSPLKSSFSCCLSAKVCLWENEALGMQRNVHEMKAYHLYK